MSVKEDILSQNPPLTLRTAVERVRSHAGASQVLGGSMIMLVGSTFVSLVNFGYNVAVARMLGPSDFSHAAAAVTLLMLVSCVTLAFQLTCAKFVAKNETDGAKAMVYHTLRRRSWSIGIAAGGACALLSPYISSYLRMPSATLILIMAVGIAFYIPLGARRGAMQGVYRFKQLSANFILEALVKFGGALLLVHLGYGVEGAVAAIAASVVIAYLFPWTTSGLGRQTEPAVPASLREGMQAIIFFIGQVVINNIDIIMVKHFFQPSEAGMYAAIALVGRVLYFASWSIVSAMFPVSAAAKQQEEHRAVLAFPLLLIAGISVAFTVFLGLFPDLVLRMLFGPGFNGKGIDSLLTLYASATAVYALAVVLIAYEISRRIANVAWLQLAFSFLVVLGITLFHKTLREVIVVQQVLMVVLLISVSLPFFHKRNSVLEAS